MNNGVVDEKVEQRDAGCDNKDTGTESDELIGGKRDTERR